MHTEFARPPLHRHRTERLDMQLVAVHPAGRQQPKQVYRPPLGNGRIHRFDQHRISKQRTLFNRLGDSGEVLVHRPPGTYIHVPHFRITHLPFRQTNCQPGGCHQRAGIIGPEPIPDRRFGGVNGIILGAITDTPSIEDDQCGRGFELRHGA